MTRHPECAVTLKYVPRTEVDRLVELGRGRAARSFSLSEFSQNRVIDIDHKDGAALCRVSEIALMVKVGARRHACREGRCDQLYIGHTLSFRAARVGGTDRNLQWGRYQAEPGNSGCASGPRGRARTATQTFSIVLKLL